MAPIWAEAPTIVKPRLSLAARLDGLDASSKTHENIPEPNLIWSKQCQSSDNKLLRR